MNFLAHLYLSGNNNDFITGNFIADHVKGSRINRFNPEIRQGIRFHRLIDVYTDTHPVFNRSRKRLAEKYRKYAGVIVDMFYDHFLSAGWDEYSDESLDAFTYRVYSAILKRKELITERSRNIITYMARDNWLKAYGTIEGIGMALGGMSRRTLFDSRMEEAVNDLTLQYEDYQEDFREFFPELVEYCERERASPEKG